MLKTPDEDPCTFYFVNYLIDNVVGVAMNYAFVKLTERIGTQLNTRWLESGYYGTPPRNVIWTFQLGVWIAIISVVKLILFFVLIRPLKTPLYRIGDRMLGSLESNPHME